MSGPISRPKRYKLKSTLKFGQSIKLVSGLKGVLILIWA